MENNKNKKLLETSTLLDEATEQMRQALNKTISDYKLPPELILAMLARISAGFTHQYQRTLTDPRTKDAVEEAFMENYNLCLYDFDMHDVDAVVKGMDNENVN